MNESCSHPDISQVDVEVLKQTFRESLQDPSTPLTDEQEAALQELSRRSGIEDYGLPDDSSYSDVLAAEDEIYRKTRIKLLNLVPGLAIPSDATMAQTAQLETLHFLDSLK